MKKASFSQRLERLDQARLSPAAQQWILGNIREHKCHIATVEGTAERPSYAYSVGLWHHFGYPEIIAFGPPQQTCEQLIDDIQTLVKVGQPPPVQQQFGQSEAHYPVELQPIEDDQWISDFLQLADWFYAHDPFPVLECRHQT